MEENPRRNSGALTKKCCVTNALDGPEENIRKHWVMVSLAAIFSFVMNKIMLYLVISNILDLMESLKSK